MLTTNGSTSSQRTEGGVFTVRPEPVEGPAGGLNMGLKLLQALLPGSAFALAHRLCQSVQADQFGRLLVRALPPLRSLAQASSGGRYLPITGLDATQPEGVANRRPLF